MHSSARVKKVSKYFSKILKRLIFGIECTLVSLIKINTSFLVHKNEKNLFVTQKLQLTTRISFNTCI